MIQVFLRDTIDRRRRQIDENVCQRAREVQTLASSSRVHNGYWNNRRRYILTRRNSRQTDRTIILSSQTAEFHEAFFAEVSLRRGSRVARETKCEGRALSSNGVARVKRRLCFKGNKEDYFLRNILIFAGKKLDTL